MVWLFGSLFFIVTPAFAEPGYDKKYERDYNERKCLEGTPIPMCHVLAIHTAEPWNVS